MKVLVVGGAGYIGSHMTLYLADQGHEVVVFDNLSRGHADAVLNQKLFIGDLNNIDALNECFTSNQFDLVMHFAALAYVGESVNKPSMYYQNNVVGTYNLIEAMRKHQVNKFVFSSTCATYGEPHYTPIDESHPQNPINPYGYTKLVIEKMLKDYAVAYNFNSISLRYFNAAGCDTKGRLGERHEPETHLIPLVLTEALRIKNSGDKNKANLNVFGNDFDTSDGTCVRDYIHVEDICNAHLLAANRLMLLQAEGAEFYNLANGKGFSVAEIIAACKRVTNTDITYNVVSRRQGDPSTLIGDASKIRDLLSWDTKHKDLEAIINSAWQWMLSKA